MALLNLHDCHIDLERRLVVRPSGSRTLSPQECGLLVFLDANPGRVVSADELLREVWGYDSRVKSRTVVTTMSRLRQKIEADPKQPRHIHNVYGKGYRFERLDQAPIAEARETPTNLGADGGGFVGRVEALTELREALSTHGLVTLLGAAGMGKTRLAVHFARTHLPAYAEGGAWFVDLVAAQTRDDVVLAVARALQCSEDLRSIGESLSSRGPTLLILDNCEQIRDPVRHCLLEWRGRAPRVRFLVTSRQSLGLSDEQLHPVEAMDPSAALALFLDRARVRRPGYASTQGDLRAITTLLQALEHVPLAVELAAARASILGPQDLLGRVERQLSAFKDRGKNPRHRTLAASIAWSWDLLRPEERQALMQCAVFEGTFDSDAAEAVLDVPGSEPLDLLESLQDASLLQPVSMPVKARFRLLVSVRTFALEQLGDDSRPRQRHAESFARFGLLILDREPGPIVAHTLRQDRPNLVAAITFTAGQPALRAKLLLAWGSWMARHGRLAAARPLLDAVELGDLTPDWQARFQLLLGRFAGQRGDLDTAWGLLRQAAEGPVPRVAALAQLALGSPDLPHGREGAVAMIHRAQGFGEAHDDLPIAAAATQRLAELAMGEGRWVDAEATLRRSLALRESENLLAQVVRSQLARCYWALERPELARRHLCEAIAAVDPEDYPAHLASILMHGADGAPAPEARTMLRRALQLLTDPSRATDARLRLARLQSLADPIEAEELWRDALAHLDDTQDARARDVRIALAEHLTYTGRSEAARRVLAAICEPPPRLMGLIHLAEGRASEALDALGRPGDPTAVVWRTCALALLGRVDEAETLLDTHPVPDGFLPIVRGFVALARRRDHDARDALKGPDPSEPGARFGRVLLGEALRRRLVE